MKPSRRLFAPMALFVCCLAVDRAHATQDDVKEDEAREHFERGIALSEDEAWDAALGEFLRSRELRATRSNTKNAALCLRKLHRFDEALEMYETLLREFPTLPDSDRQLAEQQIRELNALVGTLSIKGSEAGSSIVIDGRARGETPHAPLRLSAGTHLVRVHKQGFDPFESRVVIAGRQAAALEVKLRRLTRSGRLSVTERSGKSVVVVVDNVVVGKTPWEGSLAPGEHTIVLRGDGLFGTQPASVPLRVDETASVALAVEPLEAELRVQPTPEGASVAIDGVNVGHGIWSGRVRSGSHLVELTAPGFLAQRRKIAIDKGAHETVRVDLERDLSSPLWRAANPAHVFFELGGGALLAPGMGSDLDSSCSGTCSSSLAFGGFGVFRGGYAFANGVELALDAGYLSVGKRYRDRPSRLSPLGGLTPNPGVADDDLRLRGLLVGASAGYQSSNPWFFGLRLATGALLGTVRDSRTGRYETRTYRQTNGEPLAYSIDRIVQNPAARYVYLSPEARLGHRLGAHFELSVALSAMILTALSQPKWDAERMVPTGNCVDNPGPSCISDGFARFDDETLSGKTLGFAGMSLALRYDL